MWFFMDNDVESLIKSNVYNFLTYINNELPEGMELEYEGFYKRGFFVSKKRYAVIEDGTIIAKGLELVRRDWANVAKKTQEDILEAILEEGNPEKAMEIIAENLKAIRDRKVSLEDLVIHTQITKNLENYKQIGPHIVAAKRSKAKGRNVESGSIIRYVVVKGKGSISERAYPVEDVGEMPYDADYYINNQVIPAVSRIMSSLGYSKEKIYDLLEKEKQVSLDSFF